MGSFGSVLGVKVILTGRLGTGLFFRHYALFPFSKPIPQQVYEPYDTGAQDGFRVFGVFRNRVIRVYPRSSVVCLVRSFGSVLGVKVILTGRLGTGLFFRHYALFPFSKPIPQQVYEPYDTGAQDGFRVFGVFRNRVIRVYPRSSVVCLVRSFGSVLGVKVILTGRLGTGLFFRHYALFPFSKPIPQQVYEPYDTGAQDGFRVFGVFRNRVIRVYPRSSVVNFLFRKGGRSFRSVFGVKVILTGRLGAG